MNKLTLIKPDESSTERLQKDFGQRIVASPPWTCPVDLQLSFLQVMYAQSCGKCVPCRVGLGQLAHLMEKILQHKGTMKTLHLLEETAQGIKVSSDCAVGYEAARLVLVSIENYRDDYISHIQHKQCLATYDQPVPCSSLCPAEVDVPGYVALVHEQRYADAVALVRKDNPFPTACALVCERPCESKCRREMVDSAINIRGLKRFAVDNAPADTVPVPENLPSTGKKVAIVGGGPSGLTTAYFLQLMGHQTVVFEEKSKLGGMLLYGIPSYRFPRARLAEDINAILTTGVEVHMNTRIGRDLTMEQLAKDYDAVYVAIGAHAEKNFRVEGSNSKGMMSAVEILRKVGDGELPDFTGKKVIVIGGGNVAMDCARTSVRAGAESVSISYRRRQTDMTALPEEIEGAIAEGVEIHTLESPLRVESDKDGNVIALWVQPQISGTYDKAGRPRPVDAAEKNEVRVPCDVILVAIGQDIDYKHFEEFGIPTKWNCLISDATTAVKEKPGIYAGGDCVSGPATVIKAIAAGKIAANNIDAYLGEAHTLESTIAVPPPRINDMMPRGRVELVEVDANERKHTYDNVEYNMSFEESQQESGRCLRCDCFGYGKFIRGGRA